MSSQENIKIKCSVNFLKVLQSASEERTSQPRWSTNLAELASPDYDPHLNLDAIKESRRSLFIEGTTSGPESEYPHCIDTQLTASYTTYSTHSLHSHPILSVMRITYNTHSLPFLYHIAYTSHTAMMGNHM